MILASTSIEDVVFQIANALRYPVMIGILGCLALVLADTGAFAVELYRRRGRSIERLQAAAASARDTLAHGESNLAAQQLAAVASSASMWVAVQGIVASVGSGQQSTNRVAKCIAEFDLRSMKRLERTRMLVRFGPALGLMGTLIPLSPALTGLADGNTEQLASNLRVAFSVTVLGLLIGAMAYTISLVRDRLYAQDLSDLEAIASELDTHVSIDLEAAGLTSGQLV